MQLVTFEVPHKPGYRLKMRMGIHSGSVVAGVVGTKIPHYSVFGETVEMASIMECSGEPMKIQISSDTKEHLKVHFKEHSKAHVRAQLRGQRTM